MQWYFGVFDLHSKCKMVTVIVPSQLIISTPSTSNCVPHFQTAILHAEEAMSGPCPVSLSTFRFDCGGVSISVAYSLTLPLKLLSRTIFLCRLCYLQIGKYNTCWICTNFTTVWQKKMVLVWLGFICPNLSIWPGDFAQWESNTMHATFSLVWIKQKGRRFMGTGYFSTYFQ